MQRATPHHGSAVRGPRTRAAVAASAHSHRGYLERSTRRRETGQCRSLGHVRGGHHGRRCSLDGSLSTDKNPRKGIARPQLSPAQTPRQRRRSAGLSPAGRRAGRRCAGGSPPGKEHGRRLRPFLALAACVKRSPLGGPLVAKQGNGSARPRGRAEPFPSDVAARCAHLTALNALTSPAP